MKTDTIATKKDIVEELEKEQEEKIKGSTDKKYECVFIKEGNKAKLRVIKTGIQDDTNIEVVSGLKKGDVIIIGPYTTVTKDLNPGDKVSIKKKDAEEKEKEDKA